MQGLDILTWSGTYSTGVQWEEAVRVQATCTVYEYSQFDENTRRVDTTLSGCPAAHSPHHRGICSSADKQCVASLSSQSSHMYSNFVVFFDSCSVAKPKPSPRKVSAYPFSSASLGWMMICAALRQHISAAVCSGSLQRQFAAAVCSNYTEFRMTTRTAVLTTSGTKLVYPPAGTKFS
eukprot:SAG11_NODE_6498_length_1301_cov_42.355241_2_plen_177_part_01